MDSVVAWFDSFMSSTLATVEKFLKGLTNGSPNFSKWSEICEEMMQDGCIFHEHLNGSGSSVCSPLPFLRVVLNIT